MTRKHTVLTVLIALTAIVSMPSAFAEIEVGNYGFTQMKNANIAFNTALDQFLAKVVEMAHQVNQNTLDITELQNTSGSDNQVQVDQNSADIQSINGTIFGPYGLESNIFNNYQNIENNAVAITELQNAPAVTPTIYVNTEIINGGDMPSDDNMTVLCDTGDTVISGGFSNIRSNGEPGSTGVTVSSLPLSDLSGWEIYFQNTIGSVDYVAEAVCMDLTP